MQRCLTAFLGLALTLGTAPEARGEGASPSAEQIRSAADEYDAGRRAYVAKDYESAAVHFENAFRDAPSAEALRNAMRARRQAKQYDRAATLAALAQAEYPNDATSQLVVKETLKESANKLHKVTLNCDPECAVAADGRVISLNDAQQTIFYLDPGRHDVVISWSDNRNRTQQIDARAAGRDDFNMQAPPKAVAPTPPLVASPPPPPIVEHTESHLKPLGPAVFFIGLGLTAVGIGVTTWSGIDAENNPGAAAVQRDCVGQGEGCAEYQQGRSAQLRTNVIIGVTAGVAVATAVVGVFFTEWSHPRDGTSGVRTRGGRAAAPPFPHGRVSIEPALSFTSLPGSEAPRGGTFGVKGLF